MTIAIYLRLLSRGKRDRNMAPALSSIAYRCYDLLARWFRWHRRPELGSLALPPEIILMIGERLSQPSLLSLALTCWTLYHICFPRSPTLSSDEREEFLLHLERDTARLYFCHYCSRLHPWYGSWFPSFCRYTPGDPCRKELGLKATLGAHNLYTVPYHFARVVMNAHFYGDAHGVPIEKLSQGLRSRHDVRSGVRLSGTWRSRIVDDQLILFSEFTAFQSHGNAKLLRGFLNEFGLWVCNHLRSCPRRRRGSRCGLPELARNSSPPEYFASCTSSVNSCAVCLTDYCIDIAEQGAKGWVVKIATYQQLGPVRSPFDWTWRVATDRRRTEENRLMHRSSHPPGIVRHRWSKADVLTVEPEGGFVNG